MDNVTACPCAGLSIEYTLTEGTAVDSFSTTQALCLSHHAGIWHTSKITPHDYGRCTVTLISVLFVRPTPRRQTLALQHSGYSSCTSLATHSDTVSQSITALPGSDILWPEKTAANLKHEVLWKMTLLHNSSAAGKVLNMRRILSKWRNSAVLLKLLLFYLFSSFFQDDYMNLT